MGLREWRGRRGPCVSGVSGAECFAVDKSIKKMPFTGNNGRYILTLVGDSNTPFPPVYFSGTRAYLQVIRARVSRRHPSDRPVHHRDKAFIELFIPNSKHNPVG